MPTAFKGSIAFGLVSVPIRLVPAATGQENVLHQVHKEDLARVRNRKVCERDGQELNPEDIARAYVASDGRTAVLDDEDFAHLPLPSAHSIELAQFVEADQISSTMMGGRAYMVEPEPNAPTKPYVLLRDALAESGTYGIGRATLHGRERLVALGVSQDGAMLEVHVLLWPDEIRTADGLHTPPAEDDPRRQEITMATRLIASMTRDFDLEQLPADHYRQALVDLVEAKLDDAPLPEPEQPGTSSAGVQDLMAALEKSIAESKSAARSGKAGTAKATKEPAAKKHADGGSRGKKAAAKRAPRRTA